MTRSAWFLSPGRAVLLVLAGYVWIAVCSTAGVPLAVVGAAAVIVGFVMLLARLVVWLMRH